MRHQWCECCKRAGIDRPGRLRGAPVSIRRPILCESCFADPSNRWDECKHETRANVNDREVKVLAEGLASAIMDGGESERAARAEVGSDRILNGRAK